MPVTYSSTRGEAKSWKFERVVLQGLAPDGGLFVPDSIPQMSMKEIEALRGKPFKDVAYAVIKNYVDDNEIPHKDLKKIIEKSYARFVISLDALLASSTRISGCLSCSMALHLLLRMWPCSFWATCSSTSSLGAESRMR